MDKRYGNDDLSRMSYQELRRISILLRLPANIKKKHMISMIEAHQKGDDWTKREIANKVIEERNLKRINVHMKRDKPSGVSSRARAHHVSEDLSEHHLETRYSFVTRETDGEKDGGEMARDEAEASRRSRGVVRQCGKSTRKLSGVGRTEIVLPRNHSLTTPVQLMPQNERSSAPGPKPGGTSVPAPDASYRGAGPPPIGASPCPYGNDCVAGSFSQDSYRSLTYWHAREVYNSVNVNNGMVPNPGNVFSFGDDVSDAACLPPSTFQRQCESLIKFDGAEREGSIRESGVCYSIGIANVHDLNYFNVYGAPNRGESQEDDCEQECDGCDGCDTDPSYPRSVADEADPHPPTQARDDLPEEDVRQEEWEEERRRHRHSHRVDDADTPSLYENSFETEREDPVIACPKEPERDTCRHPSDRSLALPSFESAFRNVRYSGGDPGKLRTGHRSRDDSDLPLCRYVSGHDRRPESRTEPLPGLTPSPLYGCGAPRRDSVYLCCGKASTETTVVHSRPITTCWSGSGWEEEASRSRTECEVGYDGREEAEADVNSNRYQRHSYYAYPGDVPGFDTESSGYSSSWNDSDWKDSESRSVSQSKAHEVRLIQCKRHGYHYLYELSTGE